MAYRTLSCGTPAFAAVLTFVFVGCAPERSSTLTGYPLCCAGLDDYREVELSYDIRHDREGWEPVRTYERLVLRVRPRPSLTSKYVVKDVERKPGTTSDEFRFENVEGRTDETRQKVWFVETNTGRVIATLDRQTGHVTGPDDELPNWAIPDGGLRLVAPCERGSDQ